MSLSEEYQAYHIVNKKSINV